MASAGLTQKHRKAAIGTPLGDDVLVLKSFNGIEELGRLFQFNLVLLSEKDDIKFDDIIGQNVTVRLELADNQTRYFNGYVSRFVQVAPFNRFACYHATVVPWFWFLTQTADCRIFQDKTVPDIIEEVFKGHGFDNYQRSLSGSYETWEYCVQYRETDFQFVSRLMEQEGIYYYFKHENGKHTLVLADSKSAHEPFPGYEEISYRPPDRATSDFEHIRDWAIEKQLITGAYAHTDYDFKKPKTSLLSNSSVSREHAASDFEVFDYPGEYVKPAEGETLAKIRIQELQSRYEVMHGETDARGVCCGYHFTLKDFGRADQNRKYLVQSVRHTIEPDVFASAGGGSDVPLYHGSFSVIDAETPFRTARTTPKPIVQGPQTAMVVGPKGEEIYTDKYGRVKVMFHWDRYAKADENSSCWIRVSQSWAGKSWGVVYLPRIGHEVIVEFLEGDPDRPIITGRVYNDAAMPPYALPDNKTMSTTKSLSSKGGGGFNEIRFEDKKGSEQIFVHGEKDEDVRIKNDAREWIGHDRHLIVKKDQFELVEGDKHTEVKGNTFHKTGGDQNCTIEGGRYREIKKTDNLIVVADQMTLVNGDQNLHVKGKLNEKSDGDWSVTAGANHQSKVGQKCAVDAGQEIHLKAGMKVVIEAGMQLSLKAGSNFVDIGPAGVSISGTLVNINSGGAAGSGGGSSPNAPVAPEPPDPPKEVLVADNATPGAAEPPPPPTPPQPVTYSSAARVLQYAAEDGTPFCEECARAAEEAAEEEEQPVITSIAWLDGANDREVADATQWVNLPREDKWVDAVNGVANKDRLSQKPRYKVTFSKQGGHAFKVRAEADGGNAEYTGGEKGRNNNFKWQEQEKEYTTDSDGTKIVESDFFTTCAGLDKFKLIAEDKNNNPAVETGWLTTKRLVYLVPIKMRGMTTAADLATLRSEFASRGIEMVELPVVEIERSPNISNTQEEAFKNKCKRAFSGSQGQARSPYAVGVAFTEHLAVKNPNQTLELTGVTVGPGEEPVEIPVVARGLVAGSGLRSRSLWKNLVPGEGWFVSASFVPNRGRTRNIPEASCTAVPENASDCDTVRVDVSGLPAGTGTIRLRVNVVDRMRGGLSFPGGNLICICTKGWWQDISSADQNTVAIHEMGHKAFMVCDGTRKLPDKVATHYSGKGHVGNHCHFGLPVQDSYAAVAQGGCVMFGAGTTGSPSAFCEGCAPALRKMDLSPGWTP